MIFSKISPSPSVPSPRRQSFPCCPVAIPATSPFELMRIPTSPSLWTPPWKERSVATSQHPSFLKISITVELLPAKGALPNGGRDLTSVETLTQQLGRGLYTVDSLTASVLALEASDEDKPSPAIKDTLSRVRNLLFWHSPHSFSFQLSSSASFLSAIPPSIAKSEGLFPLAYFSDHSFFPTSHFYVWRVCLFSPRIHCHPHTQASSLTGAESFHRDLRVEIYFSLIAATFMSPVESPSLVSFPFTHPSS